MISYASDVTTQCTVLILFDSDHMYYLQLYPIFTLTPIFQMAALLFNQLYVTCAHISGDSGALFMRVSHNITSARRPAESGHEVTDRCELLSNSAGGVIYPSCGVVESEASPVVSLILYVWLRLNKQTLSCIQLRQL